MRKQYHVNSLFAYPFEIFPRHLFEECKQRNEQLNFQIPIVILITIIALLLRLWGLNNVGLHGSDEDTTALAALGILEGGWPQFPSGMYYVRAPLHSYLIAISVKLFGTEAWVFRLPSVVGGSLMVLPTYYLVRMYLGVWWAIAASTTIAVFPDLVLMSQDARMYIFLCLCVSVYLYCVASFERSGSLRSVIGAIVSLILGMQFHTLMILLAPVAIYPALVHISNRNIIFFILNSVTAIIAYSIVQMLASSFYFDSLGTTNTSTMPKLQILRSHFQLGALVLLLLMVLTTIWLKTIKLAVPKSHYAIFIATLLVALLLFNAGAKVYSIGLPAIAGLYFARKGSRQLGKSMFVASITMIAMVLVDLTEIWRGEQMDFRALIKYALDKTSPYSLINLLQSTPGLLILTVSAIVYNTLRIKNNTRVQIFYLLLCISMLPTLIVMSYMMWYPPSRYMSTALLPAILIAITLCAEILKKLERRGLYKALSKNRLVFAIGSVFVIADPYSIMKSLNTGYETHPDHIGAAHFIQKEIGPNRASVILIAEDALMATFYLGKIDYFLIPFEIGRAWAQRRDNKVVDVYTGTEIIGSGSELEMLLKSPSDRQIYIIGSGENFGMPGRGALRGNGIQEVLASACLQQVFIGRDNLTVVWKSNCADS